MNSGATLRLLIGLRVRLAWNRIVRARRRPLRLLGVAALALFGFGFLAVVGLNTSLLVERVARVDASAARGILPVLLLGMTLLALVTSMGVAFHHLFVAGDQELLLAAPLRPRDVFALKVLETWRDGVHVVLLLSAMLVGFGLALRLPSPFFATALAAVLLLTLVAATVGTALTLLAARVQFGGSLIAVSRLLTLLFLVPAGALGVPALGATRSRALPTLAPDDIQTVAATVRDLGPPPAWLPTTWAAHVMLADESAVPSTLLLIGVGLSLVVLSGLGFERGFAASWEHVRFSGPRARPRTLRRRHLELPFRGPLLSMLQKDVRVLVRDPRWRTSLLIGLAAIGVPMLVLSAGSDPGARMSPEARFWIGLFPVPYLAYVAGSQHGGASLAYEGRNLAVLRAAPVGFARLLLAKLAGSAVLVLAITWLATAVLAVRHNGTPTELLVALGIAAWLALGGTTAGLVGAALTADFETDNPQRRVGCFGTLITSGLSALFFCTNVALVVWLLMRTLGGIPRPFVRAAPTIDWVLVGLALASIVALAVAARVGVRRLSDWEFS
jgi:hypothetical protein